jgi:response regulator RpfG family c-di-GMP phosphodiesterase
MTRLTAYDRTASPAQGLLQQLRAESIILAEDWEGLPAGTRAELAHITEIDTLLCQLVELRLLTEYQAARVRAGKTFGLVLGNYRVLDRLGTGGMGVVYRGEHMRMRRQVAIKVLTLSHGQDFQLLVRFFTEIRAVAQLQHPNIVGAMDAGELAGSEPDAPVLHYFVMEYVPGKNLQEYVRDQGPLPPSQACDFIHQVACALAEATQHDLVHRDIKPSNIRVTPEGQAKLLDFGLARHFGNRQTEPGIVLGTIDYIAPEQIQDSRTVDIRADIYGLGGTLFWCLTGRTPFSPQGSFAQDVAYRLSQAAPSARVWRPDVPAELDAVIGRMMALNPDDRYASPQAVMRALLPFLKPDSRANLVWPPHPALRDDGPRTTHSSTAGPMKAATTLQLAPAGTRVHQVLIVDDEAYVRNVCRCALQTEGLQCDEAINGALALEAVRKKPYDLVLLDVDMPQMTGLEACRQLREKPPGPHLKIIMFSGRSTSDELAQMMLAGADDFLTKPFSVVQLRARIKAALRLKDAQDRSDLLTHHLLAVNAELEAGLSARDSDLVHARNALVLALAKLVEHRHTETGAHLMRMQRYSRYLAEEAAQVPTFAGQINGPFIQMLECCAPLHDIGKVALPDHILLKPGKLDPDERIIMQTHTVIGAETLAEVARQHGSAMAFLQMAIDIARHHHERWDGTGYPDRLAGSDIPLAARIVTLGDVYDALRSKRAYKPALSHASTMQVITQASPGQFDPALLQVFQRCSPHLERICQEMQD